MNNRMDALICSNSGHRTLSSYRQSDIDAQIGELIVT